MPSNKDENLMISGGAFDLGIIFAVTVDNLEFVSASTRSEDGEVTTTTKRIVLPEDSLKRPFFVKYPLFAKLVKLIRPPKSSSSFKDAARAYLKENNGKFDGEIDFYHDNSSHKKRDKFSNFMLIFVIFGLMPFLISLIIPIESPSILGVIESIIPTVLYLVLIVGSFKLIMGKKPMPKYHGAEHKAINTFMAKDPITYENIMKHKHVELQCGTNFASTLFLVHMIACVCFFFLFEIDSSIVRSLIRIISFPVVFMIITIIFRLTIFSKNMFARFIINTISIPGLWIQKTFMLVIPGQEEVEVAIAGLNAITDLMDEEGIRRDYHQDE